MTNTSDNPYAPVSVETTSADVLSSVDAKMLRDFRSQTLALGVLWILFGLMAFVVTGAIFTGDLGNLNENDPGLWKVMIVVAGLLAVGWLVSGLLSVMRNVAGVYTGLVLSYLSTIPSVIQFSLCWIVLLIVIIVQCHRVIGYAKKLSQGNPQHE